MLIVGAILVSFWPRHHPPTPPTPASLVDGNHRACILTDPGDPSLASANVGLQQAAQATGNINVQNYTIPAENTNAAPYLAGMVNAQCSLVLALGAQPDDAVDAYIQNNPKTTLKFITVGGPASKSDTITVVPLSNLTAETVSNLVKADFS